MQQTFKFYITTTDFEFYHFLPVFMTLALFQGHGGVCVGGCWGGGGGGGDSKM